MKIAISTDAHGTEQLALMELGVGPALCAYGLRAGGMRTMPYGRGSRRRDSARGLATE